jgi:dihydrolipoamide dehydrogenase
LSDIPFKSWSDVLKQTKQPKSMAVIGAGPVGCEVATFYASFGTRVVLLQSDARVLNREDEQISELAREALIRTGIEVVTGAKIEETINSRGGVYGISASVGSAIETIAVEQVVVTAGKRSNVQGLDLDQADVRINDRGQIATDKQQRTNIQHIFAAGDVDGGMMFTHTAHHEGAVAGHNATLIAKKKRTKPLMADERVVPRVTFIDPEVASVGLTQQQASEKFGKVLVGRANIATLGRSVTDNARFGMCKLVAHPKTRKLIGAHVIGERAGEVIHEAALAIHLGASVDKIASMIHAYPTYSECMASSASSVKRE